MDESRISDADQPFFQEPPRPQTARPLEGDDTALPIVLSFVAGYVEAVCFVGLFGTFTAFITGTVLILVVEFLRDGLYVTKVVVAVGFFVLTFVWTVIIRQLQARARRLRSIVFGIEALLVAAFMLVGMIEEPLASADAPATLLVAFVAVMVGSFHSTTFFLVLAKRPPTQFMTGNLTNFMVSAVDMVGLGRKIDPSNSIEILETRFKLWHYPTVFFTFFLGVAAGAWTLMQHGFVALALPAMILAVVSLASLLRVDVGAS